VRGDELEAEPSGRPLHPNGRETLMRQVAAPTERCNGVSIALMSGAMVDGDRVAIRRPRGFVLENGDTV